MNDMKLYKLSLRNYLNMQIRGHRGRLVQGDIQVSIQDWVISRDKSVLESWHAQLIASMNDIPTISALKKSREPILAEFYEDNRVHSGKFFVSEIRPLTTTALIILQSTSGLTVK
jgi:hypothetical protein